MNRNYPSFWSVCLQTKYQKEFRKLLKERKFTNPLSFLNYILPLSGGRKRQSPKWEIVASRQFCPHHPPTKPNITSAHLTSKTFGSSHFNLQLTLCSTPSYHTTSTSPTEISPPSSFQICLYPSIQLLLRRQLAAEEARYSLDTNTRRRP